MENEIIKRGRPRIFNSAEEMFGILIVAWILTWFNIDNLVIDGLNQILNTNFTTAVYWLFFFIIEVISLLKEIWNEI